MSLNKEIKELEEVRQKAAEQSRAHYQKLNLPGDRQMENDPEAARERVEKMLKEREDAHQENPYE
jgi:hypothetical protein